MTEALWLLLLIVLVGAGCYYAGWRSARAFLVAAQSMADLTNVVAAQSNDYTASMDKMTSESASLRADVTRLTETVHAKQGDVESAVYSLVQGFERAGFIRTARPGPPQQVGEERKE